MIKPKTIIIKNKVFEMLTANKNQSIMSKEFTATTSFHLARIFSKLESESKIYFSEKQKLVNKHAQKDDNGKAIINDGNYTILNLDEFSKEFNELLEIEIELGLEKIKMNLDNEPNFTVDEMIILMPFIEE